MLGIRHPDTVPELTNWYQDTSTGSSFITTCFNCIHVLLVLGGVYPGVRRSDVSGKSKPCTAFKIACVAVVILLYLGHASVFCYAIYDRAQKGNDVTRLIIYFWILGQNVYNSLVLSYTLPSAFLKLEDSIQRYENMYGLKIDKESWQRRIRITTTMIVLILPVICITFLHYLKNVPKVFCDILPLCGIGGHWQFLVFTFDTGILFTTLIQWQGYFCVCLCFPVFLLKEFKFINMAFQNLAASVKDSVEERFEELLCHHEDLVDLLYDINDCTCHFQFLYVFCSLPINCTLMYTVIMNPDVSTDYIICTPIVISFSLLAVWLILNARVSHMLHLFVCRLKGDSIGFNIYGLLTINMSSLLGLFGTLATYIIVVVQFRPTEPAGCEICVKNITNCVM